jgi:Plasmid pRiA4b ORF-3-like protein
MAGATTHIFRASLRPKLYRDIEIDSGKSLYDLAEGIVEAFDFDLDHAFGFYSKLTSHYFDSPSKYELFADLEGGESDAKSVKRTKVAQAFPDVGSKMLFLFDYGDEWRFKVEVIGLGEKVPKARYPKVLAIVGKAPPQYPDLEEEEWDED